MQIGDIPTFKIYDASENVYYNAIPSSDVAPWEPNGIYSIDNLNANSVVNTYYLDNGNYAFEVVIDSSLIDSVNLWQMESGYYPEWYDDANDNGEYDEGEYFDDINDRIPNKEPNEIVPMNYEICGNGECGNNKIIIN